MRLGQLLVYVVFLSTSAQAEGPRRPPCTARVLSPADGASNVSPQVEIEFGEFDGVCAQPSLFNSNGQAIPFDVVSISEPENSTGRFTMVKPGAALSPGTYTMDLSAPGHPTCPWIDSRATFTVGPAPSVRGVDFTLTGWDDAAGPKVVAIEVLFSEAIGDEGDLAPSSGLISVEVVDGNTPDVREDDVGTTEAAIRSFKVPGYAVQDLASAFARIRVVVKRQLAFASGESLPGDFSLEVVPAEYPYGWRPGRGTECALHQPEATPSPDVVSEVPRGGGCASVEAAPMTGLFLFAVTLFRMRRRRSG